MATKAKAPAKKVTKPAAKAPAKKATAAKPAVKPAAKKVVAAKKVAAAPKAIKAALNKTQLIAYLVEQSGVEAKSVKAVLASLETSVLGSVDKKGAGEFTLPGLFKVSVQKVPAKAKRFGKDPFTGEERWFPAAGFGEGEGSPAQEAEGRRAVISAQYPVKPGRPASQEAGLSLRDAPLHEARRLVRIYLHIKILYLKTNRAHHSSPAEPRPSPARTGAPTGRKEPRQPCRKPISSISCCPNGPPNAPARTSRPWR